MSLLEKKSDPSRQQTVAGIPSVAQIGTDMRFEPDERETLRSLAGRVAEIAARPEMAQKAARWTRHNDLQSGEPLVFIDPENGWNEIIPSEKLLCRDPLARVWEMGFRKLIFWADELRDDKVVGRYFDVPLAFGDTGWGVNLGKLGGGEGKAYIVKQAIEDYERDFEKVRYPQITLDMQLSARLLELAHGLFDGILDVRQKTSWWWTLGMTWDYINMRGLEDFLCDLVLEPEWVHRVMNLLTEGQLARLDFLESNGLLPDNTGGSYIGSGGLGYTSQLRPADPARVRAMEMWGFVESQETSSVSPEQYGEFVLPYHMRMAERFGLNQYGCCEAYDPRWRYVKQLPRLRRVSVSPWADWGSVPELLGKDYVASVKPSPTPLIQPKLDVDLVRAECARAATLTKGGICEFVMKDNHTLGGNPQNAVDWVRIMREEIDRAYS